MNKQQILEQIDELKQKIEELEKVNKEVGIMTDNTKDYELKIAITENGSRVQTINTKDNLSLELYTNKGYLQITFTKWNEDGKGGNDD